MYTNSTFFILRILLGKIDIHEVDKCWDYALTTLKTGKHIKKNVSFKDKDGNFPEFRYNYLNKKLLLDFVNDIELGKVGKMKTYRKLNIMQGLLIIHNPSF